MQETQETRVQSLGQEDPLEKGMATSSFLENPMDREAWWATTIGSHRVRNQSDLACTHSTHANFYISRICKNECFSVPHKMKGHILKFLCIQFPRQAQIHFYTLMCVGVGESRRVRKRERVCVCVCVCVCDNAKYRKKRTGISL